MADALDRLATRLGDRLVRPGSSAWDTARAAWNLTIDQRPVAVAAPTGVEELALIVGAAAEAGVHVTVQPRGHGPNGALEGTILVRPRAFDELHVDVDARVARIGSARSWGAVLRGLDGSGLIAPSGSSGVVTVAGFLLAGGHSWFSRTLGLGVRALRAVELVTASGELRRVTDDDAELMWALRGAGGAFGAVTSLEIDLAEQRALTGGRLVYPFEAAKAVLATVDELAATAPDELAIHVSLMRFPDAPMLPEEIRGRSHVQLDAVFRGTPEAAAPWLARLRGAAPVVLDRVVPFGIADLALVSDEPTEPSPASGWSSFVGTLDDDTIDRIIGVYAEPSAGALVGFELRVLGGALESGDGLPGIAGAVDAPYLAHALAFGPPEATGQAIAAVEAALGDAANNRTLATFLGPGDEYSGAYDGLSLARARAVKAEIDPDGLFVGNRAFD